MPLPSPMLDDRTYAQLRDELVRRIPVYNPEWTDHHESDPGVTLLELFASLGETLLKRFNQIPETTLLAFLQLLRVPLRPALPSRTLVTFAVDKTRYDGVRVDAGCITRAGNLAFEVLREVRAWPLESLTVARVKVDPPDGSAPRDVRDAVATIKERRFFGKSPPNPLAHYKPTPLPTDPSAPGVSAVDLGTTIDSTLWVAVLYPKDVKAADRPAMRDALYGAKGLKGATITVGIVPDDDVKTLDEVESCVGAETTSASARDGVALRWQASTSRYSPATASALTDTLEYRTLAVAGDTTRGMTRPGVVQLELPNDITALGVPDAANGDIAGTGDLPPLIEDTDAAARVLFWLRAWRSDGQKLGRIRWAGLHVAEVEQRATAKSELLGAGSGQPRQRVRLVHAPVIAGTLTLSVDEGGEWKPWTEVDSFQASVEDDRHYTLDRQAGEVTFGDGLRGRAPQIGERIVAQSYRYGGGAAGNVPARSITRVDDVQGVKVSNPIAARGGADTESLADALERIPGELRRRDRAVTAGDFRELAKMTPGADIGRAECLPRFRPSDRSRLYAGVVSVVVWPRADVLHPDAPMPDAATLRMVCAWLDARRLVTTELYVIPPTYRQISVGVSVKTRPSHGPEAVHAWVERVLRQYLSPLPPFGPEGGGWPLGRAVRGRELEAAALQVEGIEYIAGLRVDDVTRASDAATPDGTVAQSIVALFPWEVPELTQIMIVEAPEPAPGPGAPAPPVQGTPIPIPVPPEQC